MSTIRKRRFIRLASLAGVSFRFGAAGWHGGMNGDLRSFAEVNPLTARQATALHRARTPSNGRDARGMPYTLVTAAQAAGVNRSTVFEHQGRPGQRDQG